MSLNGRKKILGILIFSTFLGSSYQILSVGGISINIFRLTLLCFVGIHFVSYKFRFLHKNLNLWILICLTGIIILTLLSTPCYKEWLKGTVNLASIIIINYFIVTYTETEKELLKYLRFFAWGMLVTIFLSMFEYITKVHIAANYVDVYKTTDWQYEYLIKAPTVFLYNPNNIATLLVIGVPMGRYLFKDSGRYIQFLEAIYLVLLLLVCFMTGSRGGMLFAILGIMLMFLFNRKPSCYKVVIIIGSIFLAFILGFLFRHMLLSQLQYAGIIDQSGKIIEHLGGANERFQIIEMLLRESWNRWGLGIGPYGAETVIGSFAHNMWLEILLNYGVVGLFLFLGIYLYVLGKLWRLSYCNPIANNLKVSFLIFAVAALIPPTLFTLPVMWLIWGFALALLKIKKKEKKEYEKGFYNYYRYRSG